MSKVRCGILAVVFTTVGCASIHVDTDYDPSIDFDRFETYTFMPVVDRPEENQLLAARVRNAISVNVERQGFRKVDQADGADLLIAWHRVLAERFRVTGTVTTTRTSGWVGAYGPGYWRRYAYGGPRYAMSTTHTLVDAWTEGTMVIDIIDRENDALIFRATSRTETRTDATAEERNRIINESISRMLRDFPPGQ